MTRIDPSATLKSFLIDQGVMAIPIPLPEPKKKEQKLEAVIKEIRERYALKDYKPSTILQLRAENPDLKLGGIYKLTKELFGMDALEYLVRQGIIDDPTVLEQIQKADRRKTLPTIAEEFKVKRSELFEINGIPFRVIYQPKAGLNRLFEWADKLLTGKAKALTMEHATEINHTEITE